MTVLDTNAIVRLLTNDDPTQTKKVRLLLEQDRVFRIPTTVLLEVGWVLESIYEIPPRRIAAGLKSLLGLPAVDTDAPHRVANALAWYLDGMDIGDAFHLSFCTPEDEIATFDRSFASFVNQNTPYVAIDLNENIDD